MTEQKLTIASGAIHLEAVLHTPGKSTRPLSGVVVCHPHPLYGGDMWNNVVMAMVSGVTSRGVAALRFDFRGVGGSQGEHDNGNGEQEDALAAVTALRATPGIDPKRVGLAGYSFGAGVALAAFPRDGQLRALGVVAPSPQALGDPALQHEARPILVLAGDMDSFMPIGQVQALAGKFTNPGGLHVLRGADHFMAGYEADIAEKVGLFFHQALKP